MSDTTVRVGVIGVGSMGQHHVRVYDEIEDATLVGIADADDERAAEIATEYGTTAMSVAELLDNVDAVSVAVPTPYHFETAMNCIHNGVDLLIEKPIAETEAEGLELIETAEANDVTIQIGHIERFNPAVSALDRIMDSADIVALRAERLGPPPERDIHDNVVVDLMIHDVDIVLSLLDAEPITIQSAGTHDNKYVSATLQFESGVVGTLISSRLTQRKVRKLKITTESEFIELDYLDQTIDIHRRSVPEFVERDSGVQYRHESIIERPQVETHEPLKAELSEFIDSVRNNSTPRVSGRDGLRVFELVNEIDDRTETSREDQNV